MTHPGSSPGWRVLREDRWQLLAILVFTLLLHGLAAWPLRVPGYMDACYYYNGAVALHEGQGFVDNYLWNYLDDPAGIPHPSHLYWMPLPSVMIYLAFLVLGSGLRSAQLVGVLLSAFLPSLAYWLSRVTSGERWQAFLAAGLMAFSGFYLAYWPAPDGFALFGLVGSLCLLALGRGLARPSPWPFAAAGALAGLAHLTRADGLLLASLAVILPWVAFCRVEGAGGRQWSRVLLASGAAVLAYLAVMAPWAFRNMQVLGQPFPSTGVKTLFLRDYDDIFAYGRDISLGSYLAWGCGNILRSKVEALWTNAQTVVAVWLQVFAAPLALVGFWRLRRDAWFQVAALYGALLYLSMSLGFSAPGPRGTLFHSGAALLPFLYAAVGPGLEGVILWVRRWRQHWQPERACRVFAACLLVLSALLGAALYARTVWGGGAESWNQRDVLYPQVEEWLEAHASPQDRVMVVNPPCFYYFSRRPCLAIPNEPLPVVLEAADRYGVRFLLLEPNHPRPLEGLYQGEEGPPRLRPRANWAAATLFEIVREP